MVVHKYGRCGLIRTDKVIMILSKIQGTTDYSKNRKYDHAGKEIVQLKRCVLFYEMIKLNY